MDNINLAYSLGLFSAQNFEEKENPYEKGSDEWHAFEEGKAHGFEICYDSMR